MTIKLTDLHGEDIPVENPSCIPLIYRGKTLSVGNTLAHIIKPVALPYLLEMPDNVRAVVSATGKLFLKNPNCVNKDLGGVVIPDGHQHVGNGQIHVALMSLKPIGFVPINDGDVIAELRFESVPAVKINAKVGRPRKSEAA